MPTQNLAEKQLLILRRGLNKYRNNLIAGESVGTDSVFDALGSILSSSDARTVAARKPGRPSRSRGTSTATTK